MNSHLSATIRYTINMIYFIFRLILGKKTTTVASFNMGSDSSKLQKKKNPTELTEVCIKVTINQYNTHKFII